MAKTKRGPKFTATEEAPVDIGHNIPPTEIEQFRENLAEQTRAIGDRIADLAVGALRVPDPITEENASTVTSDLVQ